MSTSMTSPSICSPISTLRPRIRVQTSMATFISLTIGLYFWIGSRYPALLKKLHSGKGIQTKGAVSLDALMPVTPARSLMTEIGHTTVNWICTNCIGMTFGIRFGRGYADAAFEVASDTLQGHRVNPARPLT
jgi:hypothetical protein